MSSRKTLNQDVALLGQAPHKAHSSLALDVQGEALFPSVQVEEGSALLCVRHLVHEGTCSSRHIPGAGWLDLDDLCTQSGQEFGTEGAGDILTEVKDAYISQDEIVFRHGSVDLASGYIEQHRLALHPRAAHGRLDGRIPSENLWRVKQMQSVFASLVALLYDVSLTRSP
jgi:hypothetical protein